MLRSVSKSELQPRSFNLTLYEIKTAQPPRAIICTAAAALRLHCITNYRSSMINGSAAPARQILGSGVLNGHSRTILAPPLTTATTRPPPSFTVGTLLRSHQQTLRQLSFLGQTHTYYLRTSGGRGSAFVRKVWEEVLLQLGNENEPAAEKKKKKKQGHRLGVQKIKRGKEIAAKV